MSHAADDHGLDVEPEAEREHDGDGSAGAAVIGCEQSVIRGRESRGMPTAMTTCPSCPAIHRRIYVAPVPAWLSCGCRASSVGHDRSSLGALDASRRDLSWWWVVLAHLYRGWS